MIPPKHEKTPSTKRIERDKTDLQSKLKTYEKKKKNVCKFLHFKIKR